MRQRLVERRPRKEHAEFLAAVAVGAAAAAHLGEPRSDELQHLVADVVAVLIVEILEMVDVDHRDRVAAAEAPQALLERAPPG